MNIIVTSYCTFLNNLFGRGLFYVFVGVLFVDNRFTVETVLACIVIAIGFLYMLLHCVPQARPTKKSVRI